MDQHEGAADLDSSPRTKVGVAVLVVLFHVIVVLGLIRAFAPDFAAKAVETVVSTFTVTITAPPPPEPAKAPDKAGAAGDAGRKAVAREVNAAKAKVELAKTPAPRAASTGAANTSGAAQTGGGTGAGGTGSGPGAGGSGTGAGGGAASKVQHIGGQINNARDFPVPRRTRGTDRQGGDSGADRCPIGPGHRLPRLQVERSARYRCGCLPAGDGAAALQARNQCGGRAGDRDLLLAAEVLFLTPRVPSRVSQSRHTAAFRLARH